MKILSFILTTLCLTTTSSTFAQSSIDYTTSVKVNGIELINAISSTQVEKLIGQPSKKINKQFSECTGNYEYSTSTSTGKNLKFEIYREDNPQVKSENFYKTKNNFQQLDTTKGMVWLSWANAQSMTDTILINSKVINKQYTPNQFKKDFPNSAKTGTNSVSVLMLDTSEVKQFLKNPADFEVGYTASVHFAFKNGKLNTLAINQAIAC
ncbi:hypothetical protein [Acinetobacter wuhouensis]|uniref:Uncharacterized protein n=1 Tax=Acinetobacter wuhouensis TaxID=1879050 RepID=A0A3G2T186_9GAMM|nr:hypothetical protein [Acinetobacter wuhouensis]AYO53934.1 hypothetical protein CDG68_09955 [Acinetobacter wuhouensis]